MRDDDQLLWRQRGLIQLMTFDLHLSVNWIDIHAGPYNAGNKVLWIFISIDSARS